MDGRWGMSQVRAGSKYSNVLKPQVIVLLANWDLADTVGVAHFPSIPPDRGVIGIARLHVVCVSNAGRVAA